MTAPILFLVSLLEIPYGMNEDGEWVVVNTHGWFLFLSDLFVHLERVASEVPCASWAEHFFGCPLKSSGVCV